MTKFYVYASREDHDPEIILSFEADPEQLRELRGVAVVHDLFEVSRLIAAKAYPIDAFAEVPSDGTVGPNAEQQILDFIDLCPEDITPGAEHDARIEAFRLVVGADNHFGIAFYVEHVGDYQSEWLEVPHA